jgi:DNA-binding CsgD family transcriptional regulator/PAS domain-containing protein
LSARALSCLGENAGVAALQEIERLSLLISDIYDASLDRSLWPAALEKICAFVGGSAANLFSQVPASKEIIIYLQWNVDPHYEQLYFEKYSRMNPYFPGFAFFEVGKVHAGSDIMPFEEFIETRFYKEWVRPQGFIDVLGVNIEKSATSMAMLAIRRSEQDGRVDDEARRRLALLAPHVQRAVMIGNVLDFKQAQVTALTDTFASLSGGVFIVDANSQIVFSNPAGQAMLAEGAVLRPNNNGALSALDPKANQLLCDTFSAAGNGDSAVGIKGISIPLTAASGTRWYAHVLPLTSGSRKRAGVLYDAAAAVFLRRASLETTAALETLSKVYKLTPTELRVLLAFVEIGGGPAVAEALGIAETTVKTHLQKLYEKTGAQRHADLVKLVAASSSPFANG